MAVQGCRVTGPTSEHWTQPHGAMLAQGNMHDEALATAGGLGFRSCH